MLAGSGQLSAEKLDQYAMIGELALDRVANAEMPPASASAIAPPLSAEEVELLQTWVEEGKNP